MKNQIAAGMIALLLLSGCSGVCCRKSTVSRNRLISAAGIGSVRIGTTISALKKAGHYVLKDKSGKGWRSWLKKPGKDDHPTGVLIRLQTAGGEERKIARLETSDGSFAVASGVRCGMMLSEAVRRLGAVQLTLYSSLDGSPEYASFAGFKGSKIAFQVKCGDSREAGIYQQNEGGIILTEKIRKQAYICKIIVFSGKFRL